MRCRIWGHKSPRPRFDGSYKVTWRACLRCARVEIFDGRYWREAP